MQIGTVTSAGFAILVVEILMLEFAKTPFAVPLRKENVATRFGLCAFMRFYGTGTPRPFLYNPMTIAGYNLWR